MLADTIENCDREIARLMTLVSEIKRRRKSLVQRERMTRNRENPVFLARWRDGMAIAAADPGRRALRSFNASQGQKNSPRGLPPMTRREMLDYHKLRRHMKFTREEALAEIFRNSGAPLSPKAPRAAPPPPHAEAAPAVTSLPSGRD